MSHVFMLFGKGGLIGNAFCNRLQELAPQYRVFAFDRPEADISNKSHVVPLINYVKPTVLINCAAVNDLEMCEDAKTGAFTVNAVGPEVLAEACKKHGTKFVHISSCMVFDGNRSAPYTERCKPNPINVHGQSKFEGEKAAVGAYGNTLIVRPGWAFHYEGDNPVTDWITRAERRLNISVRGNCQGSPTYVPDLVEATVNLINEDASGVYHVANGDGATWETFADAVVSLSKLRTKIVPASGELKQWLRAPIPKYSVLSTKKYSSATGRKMRSWADALKECLFEMHRYRP